MNPSATGVFRGLPLRLSAFEFFCLASDCFDALVLIFFSLLHLAEEIRACLRSKSSINFIALVKSFSLYHTLYSLSQFFHLSRYSSLSRVIRFFKILFTSILSFYLLLFYSLLITRDDSILTRLSYKFKASLATIIAASSS